MGFGEKGSREEREKSGEREYRWSQENGNYRMTVFNKYVDI